MRNFYKITCLVLLFLISNQCRRDDDMNFRIRIENHCDFGIKVYYDNQDIEEYEDGSTDISVTGSVSYVPAYGTKKIYSQDKYVWIETSTEVVKARKFKCQNADILNKEIVVYPEDFE